uniref:transposase domain-containing protein n=1 Tax=Variovorax boronicumulans TaxID=436515 RepID=UPI0027D83F57|nr:transposase domain-containing protein [Variovorax boronicumulans]
MRSLIHWAKLNRRDPCVYLRDILERLPTHPASRTAEVLPHRWQRQPHDRMTQ